MKHIRALSLLALVAGLGTLPTSCADTTAPERDKVRPSPSQLGVPTGDGVDVSRTVDTTVTTLQRLAPLSSDISASAVIGSEGGTISIADAGFTLTIPREALSEPTAITVTAIAGSAVAYEFAPHGLLPKKNLVFSQEIGSTVGAGLLGALYKGGYFETRGEIDASTGSAVVHEIIEASADLLTIRFPLSHFSGYLVAVGASDEEQ